jgi:hypothetical protein
MRKKCHLVSYIFVPLALPRILKPPHLCVNIMLDCIPEFDGNPSLVVDFLEFFMNYVTNANLVFEDDLMMAFAGSMQGHLAKKWYCRFQPKEIKYFPQLVKRFQKDWISGYEEVEDVQVLIDLQGRMLEKINDLVMEYGEHPSDDILPEIKEKMDALRFLVEYTQAQHLEPHMQRLENE